MSDSIKFTTFRGSKSGELIQSETSRPALTGDDVLVSVTASGLCSGDLMFKGNDMVLGHEGVGTVAAVGPDVTLLRPGDRVGWGFLQDACGRCAQCDDGAETFCPARRLYGSADLDQGSLAYAIVKKESRLLDIPGPLADTDAAPLMCAGATVFNALESYGARPAQRAGVVGIGGLGHLAIQFAAKMGLDVVAFTSSADKTADVLSLGASACYTTAQLAAGQRPARAIDVLLVTTPQQPADWGLYVGLLAPRATVFPLTIGPGDVALPAMPLLMNGLTVRGSVVAGRGAMRRMLDFAASHGVKPRVQRFDMDKEGIEEAFGVLAANRMRYRGVLVVPEDKRFVVA